MSSSKKGQIESAKIVIGEVFSRFWFRIPDYQRAYVWGKDEISELIDDVNYASEHNPEGQYFLGSMVLRKATRTADGVSFEEYELLDGQQRLTTLMLMLACIRDRVTDAKLKGACREMLFQEENKWKKIPGRNRIVYDIRDNVGAFIERYIKADDGFISPTDEAAPSSGIRYKITLTMAKGRSEGRESVRVIISKVVERKRDFFSDPEELASDGLEEKIIFYRIERELLIDEALKRAAKVSP